MAAILQSLTFGTDNKATLGPCPLGSVWTVLVSVPRATNSSSFEVYLQGTQLGSMQGTATFGPFQMRGNEVLTIVSTGAQVTAAQTVTVMGQADSERNAPTGIFPVVSGGVVTTSGVVSATFLVTPPTYYAPSALASYTISTTTVAAIDTTNLTTGSFVAPTSGRVLVRVSATISAPSGSSLFLALFEHGTTTQVGVSSFTNGTTGSEQTYTSCFLVTALTAGTGYQFDLAASCSSPGATLYAQGSQGNNASTPCAITVEAA